MRHRLVSWVVHARAASAHLSHSVLRENVGALEGSVHGGSEGFGGNGVARGVEGVQRHQQLRGREHGVCAAAHTTEPHVHVSAHVHRASDYSGVSIYMWHECACRACG